MACAWRVAGPPGEPAVYYTVPVVTSEDVRRDVAHVGGHRELPVLRLRAAAWSWDQFQNAVIEQLRQLRIS